MNSSTVRDYFNFIGNGPSDLMNDRFDALSKRIRAAAEAHESFLVDSNSL
jgi:hypothetical protein